jgi:TolB-like protein
MTDLLTRLKQRKLVQWAIAYVAFAFALLQGIDIVAQRFGWPETAERILIVALAVGFFVALVLAWYDGERGAQRVSGAELLILALLLAIGGGLLWRFARAPEVAAVASPVPGAPKPHAEEIPAKSIAVLPFENLSGDKDNAYFVSGMQDMILTSLSKFDGLKVISRTSTEKYASRPENLKQVATELGAAHVLEGSVQRAGDRVLINLQLIDARSDAHLWAESYERQVADVFSVEREVAGVVATALRAKLLPTERASIGQAPTANPQAMDLYLRGEYEARVFFASTDDADIRSAIGHYEQAVAADPQFALAWAHLANARLWLYWSGNNTVPDQSLAAAARDAANRALELAPGLPDSELAKAFVEYRLDLDYQGALASFDAVLARRPQSVDALMGKAQALRRLGRYDEAIASYSAAVATDPRDSSTMTDRGITDFLADRLDAAEADFRRSLSINPTDDYAATYLGMLFLYRNGDPDKALAMLRGHSFFTTVARVQVLTCARRFDDALAAIDQGVRTGANDQSYAILKAQVLAFMGRQDAARQLLQPKMPGYRKTLVALPVNSGNGQVARFQLAMAETILGNGQQALTLTADGLQLLSPEKDKANGSASLGQAARVYAMLGRTDLLLPMLARIRALKGTDMATSAAILRLDPVFDKVRNDPGFQAEVERFAEKQAMQARQATTNAKALP